MFNLVMNAEDYWHQLCLLQEQRIDTLSAAIDFFLKAKNLSMDNESDLAQLKANWDALSKADKDTIVSLQKQVGDEKKKKKWWKRAAIIEAPPAIVGIITILMILL